MSHSSLQQEIRKKRPFDSLEEEAALNLLRTVDHLQHEFCRLFTAHNISGPQYNVLRILRGHGLNGMPCQEIGGQMIARTPDVTRLVDRLVEARLATRGRSDEDRRLVLVRVTQAGLDLLEQLDGPVMELHRQQMQHLSQQELTELNRLLVKVRRRR